jgi:hypothetical protein
LPRLRRLGPRCLRQRDGRRSIRRNMLCRARARLGHRPTGACCRGAGRPRTRFFLPAIACTRQLCRQQILVLDDFGDWTTGRQPSRTLSSHRAGARARPWRLLARFGRSAVCGAPARLVIGGCYQQDPGGTAAVSPPGRRLRWGWESGGERRVHRLALGVIEDREHHLVEPSGGLGKRVSERAGHNCRIVAEHAAPPRAEHKPPLSMGGCHGEHPPGPGGETVASSAKTVATCCGLCASSAAYRASRTDRSRSWSCSVTGISWSPFGWLRDPSRQGCHRGRSGAG